MIFGWWDPKKKYLLMCGLKETKNQNFQIGKWVSHIHKKQKCVWFSKLHTKYTGLLYLFQQVPLCLILWSFYTYFLCSEKKSHCAIVHDSQHYYKLHNYQIVLFLKTMKTFLKTEVITKLQKNYTPHQYQSAHCR